MKSTSKTELELIERIAELVPHGSRVLDLGCGNGELLSHLQTHKACTGYGIEIDDDNVLACVRRGVQVLQLNLESGLALFADHSFDVVLQINTLQNLRNAKTMLLETARVGRLGVVVFPNFAHWPNRWAVLRGRMPVTKALPYEWHNTPNIRVGTFADFDQLARNCGLHIHTSFGLQTQNSCAKVHKLWSNARADSAVFTFSQNAAPRAVAQPALQP